MENEINLQCNKIIHLENSMVMYSTYNSETLEKLVTTVHKMHDFPMPNENYLPVHLLVYMVFN